MVAGRYNIMLYGYKARTVITRAAVLKIRSHLCPRYVTFCHHRTTNSDCFSIHSFPDYIIIICYITPTKSAKHGVLASTVLIKFDRTVPIIR